MWRCGEEGPVALTEIVEQVLAIASQQLQLAGNVRAALLALQLADARLAKADRPQFVPVRRALAREGVFFSF